MLVFYLGSLRGRPSGYTHRSAGLLVHALAVQRALAVSPRDVFWCAVDIGWVSGQSHGVYGPLAAGATMVLYEGTLDTPSRDRTWAIIERYRVGALVTTPSIVRNLHEWVDSPPEGERLASLRSLITAGEAIEPAVRDWLEDDVGGGRAVVRDGWGQTELGAIVSLTPEPDPPLPDAGFELQSAGADDEGELELRHPGPGQFLTVHGDHDDARTARYWARPGRYTTGDLVRRTPDGDLEPLGRIDPVVSVLGQLVSANEVRALLLEHPFITAAEVVGRPDPRRGQAVVAAVVVSPDAGLVASADRRALARELRRDVEEGLGGLARPETVAFLDRFPDDLPSADLRLALAEVCRGRTEPFLTLQEPELRRAAKALERPLHGTTASRRSGA